MAFFDEKVRKQLIEMIGDLPNEANLVFFTKEEDCAVCKDTLAFVEEIASLHDNIKVTVFDLEKDIEAAKKYGVDKAPAIVALDKDMTDFGMRFYGPPAGYEINSFLASIREVGGHQEPLPEPLLNRIKAIDQDVHIQVFVTPTCPHCPGPVVIGHRLALENEHITADMVEASTFPELSNKYGVRGVPKIVINEKYEFVGSQPISKFLEVIEGMEPVEA